MGVNEAIRHINEAIKSEEFESINVTTICADKDKKISSVYDTSDEEKTPSTSEKKENHAMVMFACMNTENITFNV